MRNSPVDACRRLPYIHDVDDEDRADFDSWLRCREDNVHSAPVRRHVISSEKDVALKFSVGVGSLFPFQGLADPAVQCDINVSGPVFAHRDWWMDVRSHFLFDLFPVIAWLRILSADMYSTDETAQLPRFLLDNFTANREFLQFIDPGFESRVLWVNEGQTVCIRGKIHVPGYIIDSTKDSDPTSSGKPQRAFWKRDSLEGRPHFGGRSFGHPLFHEYARDWILERTLQMPKAAEPVVIYYARGKWAGGGRVLDKRNETHILQSLRQKMDECGRREKIVYYTGLDEHGHDLSQEEQFQLFRAATLFIGPHGGGGAGMLFMMSPTPHDERTCESRPQVVEFIPGPRSGHVHWAFASFYQLWFGAPWTEYHLIQYLPNSSQAVTYVGMDAWEAAARAIFSGARCHMNASRDAMVEREENI